MSQAIQTQIPTAISTLILTVIQIAIVTKLIDLKPKVIEPGFQ